ncbi:MAG: HDOD domain-containing protein [Alteromonadaceae bacterium]|nr:HDOD domain-containing protein [Alteromonadaceae bacterium]
MDAMDYAEKAEDIFVLSDSYVRIKELIDDEASTIDDIAEVIILDPALSGTLLKLANSSFFNYPGKIDTISKAVLVLGITEVYNLIVAYFTTETFKTLNLDQDFLDDFWASSVDCALILTFLGSKLDVPNSERLFILGLLHNLGELLVQEFNIDEYKKYQINKDLDLPWDKQQKILDCTFADCSAELMKSWQLPFCLVEPVRYQDSDDFQFSTLETQLLYISKRVMLKNTLYDYKPYAYLISEDKLQALGITEKLLDEAVNYCDIERLSILAVLNPGAAMIF